MPRLQDNWHSRTLPGVTFKHTVAGDMASRPLTWKDLTWTWDGTEGRGATSASPEGCEDGGGGVCLRVCVCVCVDCLLMGVWTWGPCL
jgi:hypothetical protein